MRDIDLKAVLASARAMRDAQTPAPMSDETLHRLEQEDTPRSRAILKLIRMGPGVSDGEAATDRIAQFNAQMAADAARYNAADKK